MTVLLSVMVMLHVVFVLLQAPYQLVKVELSAGVAVSVTSVPLSTVSVQVEPQLIDPPVTVPVPVLIFVTVSLR